jgi:hypothetical protein
LWVCGSGRHSTRPAHFAKKQGAEGFLRHSHAGDTLNHRKLSRKSLGCHGNTTVRNFRHWITRRYRSPVPLFELFTVAQWPDLLFHHFATTPKRPVS